MSTTETSRPTLRTTARSAAKTAAAGGLVAGLTPIWAVDRAWSSARTARATGGSRGIPRIGADRGDPGEDLGEVITGRRPVVVEGLLDRLELDVQPDLAGMRSVADRVDERFLVTVDGADHPYYLYVGDYGREILERHQMTMHEFLDHMFVTGPPAGTVTYRLFGTSMLDGAVARIIDEIGSGITALTDASLLPSASGIWIGSTGVVTPLHHDAWPGILFQTEGTKRVDLYHPRERVNLAFSSPFAATDTWSRIPGRAAEADPEQFPRIDRAERHHTVLQAGDALVIPPFWAHEIEALEPNISIPFRFASRPSAYVNPGFLRPACEVFHRRITRS